MSFTVALDGPAAAGKGTIGRALAEHFGFGYLDSGLLYRAVGRKVLDGADPLQAARALRPEDLQAEGLRSDEVALAASRVAADPGVRAALVDFQRAFARRSGGAVLDGRAVRASGAAVTLEEVAADLRARDARDSARAVAPLRRAPDAVLLDTTEMSIDEALGRAIALVEAARRERGASG